MHSSTTIYSCFLAVLSYLALDTACHIQTSYNVSVLDSSRVTELSSSGQLYTYLGLRNGRMLRCDMSSFCCARFNTFNQPITSIAVHNSILYAGLADGLMMMCPTNVKDACWVQNNAGRSINGIAVQGEYVYAGMDNGIVWRCRMYEANSCEDFTRFPNESVQSLAITNQYIFVGLKSGNMLRCNIDMPACLVLNSAQQPILSLAASGGYIFAGLNNGLMWRCRTDIRDGCETYNNANTPIHAMTIARQHIYAALENKLLWQCNEGWADSCVDLERTDYVIDSMDAFYV